MQAWNMVTALDPTPGRMEGQVNGLSDGEHMQARKEVQLSRVARESQSHSLVAKELATSLAPIPQEAPKLVKDPMTSSHT